MTRLDEIRLQRPEGIRRFQTLQEGVLGKAGQGQEKAQEYEGEPFHRAIRTQPLIRRKTPTHCTQSTCSWNTKIAATIPKA